MTGEVFDLAVMPRLTPFLTIEEVIARLLVGEKASA